MKKALKIFLTTVLVSIPLFLIIDNFGGFYGEFLAFLIPFPVFSFFFVFYHDYDGFLKNYLYPLIIAFVLAVIYLIYLFTKLVSIHVLYGQLAPWIAALSFVPAVVLSLLGSYLGRVFRGNVV